MKKRLLSLLGAVFAVLGISAQVQSLDLSTLKGENAETPDSVYLLNVEANGFLCGANAWGTQASYGTAGQLYVITDQGDGTYTLKTSSGNKAGKYLFRDNADNSFIDMASQGHNFWSITKNDESGYYRIQTAPGDASFGVEINDNYANEFFGWRGDIASTIINCNVSPDDDGVGIDWAFISQETYAKIVKRINLKNAIMKCDTYGIPAESYISLVEDDNATDEQLQAATDGINARINLSKAIDAAWNTGFEVPSYYDDIIESTTLSATEVQDAITNLNARAALWSQIIIAEEADLDATSYAAIANDLAKTTDEINDAKAALMTAIDMLQVEENAGLLEGATDTDPIELFGYGILKNSNFNDKNIDGWTANLKGNNGGQMDPNGTAYTNGSVNMQYFAESWHATQHTGDGEFYQKVGLPQGLYTLEADIIATRQSGTKEDSKGVELYAQNTTTGELFTIPVATGNGVPEHFTLNFKGGAGLYKIGLKETAPTVNWIAMDNWKLTYYGNTDKPIEQIELGKVIAGLVTRYNNHVEAGDHMGRIVLVDAYDALYEEVAAIYENGGLEDVSEYIVWGDSLTKAYNAVSASIQDYKQFAKNMEAVQERITEQEEMNPACAAELADYYDVLTEEWQKAEWTRTEIDEIPSMVAEILGHYTDVKPGDDVTFYLNNAKFTKDFSGWKVTGATPAYQKNHGQGSNDNADLCQEEPEEDDGLAECYHATFDMSQTIKNLPAGLYTLSVQGFNRHDDGNNQSAVLYAKFTDGNEQTQDFASIDEYATVDQLYRHNNANGEAEWFSDANRNGLYAPNGMTGAAWHFKNKKDGENYDYTSQFEILMKEDGDLTVGVRCENAHQWVIWDNFTLVYEGSGAAVWVKPLEDEIAKIQIKYEEANATSGEKDAIDEVIDEAYALIKAIEDATEEDCQAMLLKLQSQYSEITKNNSLVNTITGYYDKVFSETVQADLEEKDDADLMDRYDAICDLVEEGYDDLNNTELEAAIEEINAVLKLIKMPKGWENATDENPVDFSKMIANRFFNHDGSEDPEYDPDPVQNHTFTEWQGTQPGTGGGTPGNCGEVWNSAAFNMYQELTGMPEGTYILSCQGYLRHGDGTTGNANSYAILNGEKEQTVYAYLYGTTSEGQYSTELQNIASVQLTQEALDSLGINVSAGTSAFGENYLGASQLLTADNFFKAGYYNNSITVKVGADGVLRIGIQKIGAVTQDWIALDNFSLIYLGKESSAETSEDPKTAIDAVETTSQKAIYTITGLRMNKVAKPGLYIINGKKVLVK